MTVSEGVNDLLAERDGLLADKGDLINSLTSAKANFSALNAKYQLRKERH